MINIIAGEDQTTSRKKLSESISGKKNVIRVDGKKTSLGNILDSLVANDLFSESKTIVIENFTKVKPQKEFYEKVLELEKDKVLELILWEADELDTKTKTAFKSIRSFNFSFPKFYFNLLDSLSPHSKESINLLHEVLKTLEAEQVLYGLIKRIRHLMVLKSPDHMSFSEFARMQSWQLGKLRKQSDFWSEDQLKDKFLELTDLDMKMRTSGLTMPLSDHLDIVVLSDL